MKIKYIAVPALAVISSCSWTQKQAGGAMDWADRTMPTYQSMNKPADSKVSAYPANIHMTAAQATSAKEGGNSRPMLGKAALRSAPPAPPTFHAAPSTPTLYNAPSAYTGTAPSSGANIPSSTARRVPAGMLPPSAIQPAPYGQIQQAPAKMDDFPAEYKNSGKSSMDPMVPSAPM